MTQPNEMIVWDGPESAPVNRVAFEQIGFLDESEGVFYPNDAEDIPTAPTILTQVWVYRGHR